MKKQLNLGLGTLVALFAGFYAAYYILLADNCLHLSVASIIAHSHQLPMKTHLMVLGLIPIYIAIVIFGAAMLAVYYLGPTFQMFLKRTLKRSGATPVLPVKNS